MRFSQAGTDTNLIAMVGADRKKPLNIYVTFRGTEPTSLSNWFKTNADMRSVDISSDFGDCSGCKIHKGNLKAINLLTKLYNDKTDINSIKDSDVSVLAKIK